MQQDDLFAPAPAAVVAPEISGRPDKIWLVDGHHLAFRSYFAFDKFLTSKGEPTQMVFGFMRVLQKLLKEKEACVIVVFDPPTPTFRHDSYEDYKAGRAETPDDFGPQIEKVFQIVDLMGLKRLEIAGFEADDVIGTLAVKAAKEGYPVKILTGDRDSFQLISDQIQVVLPDGREMTPSAIKEKYGVEVSQWVDYRSLVGDSSDNLPGAKGIGEKTAAKLLQEHHSLAGLYESLSALTPKVQKSLEESRENVELSNRMSKLETEVPLEINFDDCHVREIDRDGLRTMLEQLEFGAMMREMDLLAPPPKADLVDWPPPLDAFLGFVFDKPHPIWANWTGLGAAFDSKVAKTLPSFAELEKFPEIRAIAAKDLSVLALKEGHWVTPGDDPLLLAYLIDPSNNDAAATVRRYGAGDWTDDPAQRAQAAKTLWDTMKSRSEINPRIEWLYNEIEKPLSSVLAKLEARGMVLDVDYLKELSDEMGLELNQLEADLQQMAGKSFNVNSRDQLETILFDELGLTVGGKKTTTGKRSTAASVLEELVDQHPIVQKILDYRELNKLKGTYLDPLPKLVHPKTGRLHTRLNQCGTATGRLSSVDPNLQNIPVRTEVGRKIRKAFRAAPGMKLIVADYSQIELRILAHLSGDENLQAIFKDGKDIHTQTAAWMFDLPLTEVSKDQRSAAKTINFGVLYGMSAFRLSNELSISFADAQDFINRYFDSFPKVKAWIESTLEFARQNGYVETFFGRRRYVADLDARIKGVREAAERTTFNTPVQGTATGDLVRLAMVKLQPELEKIGAHMVLQIHDELIVEVDADRADETAEVVQDVMRHAWAFDVPLEVGVGIGDNWLEAK